MRSRASIRGHPIHPALIPFPFAFLTGAMAFDVVGVLLDRPALWGVGYHLIIVGVATALLAAVPGIVDYFGTVPPHSSGKRRATWHGLLNLTATTLFAFAWFGRDATITEPSLAALAMEIVAVGLLSVGGWMGGTLTFRNQIGVDHRFAGAGKWSEVKPNVERGRIVAAAHDELEVDQMKLVILKDRRIVLARTRSGYVAFDDRCPHSGGSLAGGALICGTVQCPWHGSQFDVHTGEERAGPAERGIETYPVESDDGLVRILLDRSRATTASSEA